MSLNYLKAIFKGELIFLSILLIYFLHGYAWVTQRCFSCNLPLCFIVSPSTFCKSLGAGCLLLVLAACPLMTCCSVLPPQDAGCKQMPPAISDADIPGDCWSRADLRGRTKQKSRRKSVGFSSFLRDPFFCYLGPSLDARLLRPERCTILTQAVSSISSISPLGVITQTA